MVAHITASAEAMAWLYCTVHGRGHENRVIIQQDDYCRQGESVLIVHGKLKTGPHRCDKCNGAQSGQTVTTDAVPNREESLGNLDLDGLLADEAKRQRHWLHRGCLSGVIATGSAD